MVLLEDNRMFIEQNDNMAVDILVMEGAWASSAMLLTQLSQNILVSSPETLILAISLKFTPLAQGQPSSYPSASDVTLKNVGKWVA